MRSIVLVGDALFAGFLVGHGLEALQEIMPLFAMIGLLYAGLAAGEVQKYRTVQRRRAAGQRRLSFPSG